MDSRKSSAPLIRTKLHRPSVPFDVVGRDRLLRLMGRAVEVPLTLVSAPAGYGKSVLVAQWAEHCDHPVAWLSLDEDESDLRLFLQYLVAAVHTVADDACRATTELLQATELPPPSVLAGHLLNDFEALGQPLAIVLDDYHRIQISSPVHDLMGRLLEHPPSSVRLVLVTRRDPPLPFMSLLAGNQVAAVRLEELRFTGGETAEVISATADLAVSNHALSKLEQQVEGWAAGLRLVVLALRHAVDPETLLSGLGGGLPQTRAYLLREALSGLPPENRDWLLKSSILDRFCPGLLEAVCSPVAASAPPGLTGRKFLDLIQRENLFTIALDTRDEWFR
ncbi:MAG: AAA family ATPase, partial [Thermoanaerobaculia bacterium]